MNLQNNNQFSIGSQTFKLSQTFKEVLVDKLEHKEFTPVSFKPNQSPVVDQSDMFIPDEKPTYERLNKIVSMTDNFMI